MKQKIVKITLYVLIGLISIACLLSSVLVHNHNKSLIKQVDEQTKIIDSLLNRRMKVVDVELYVTDKSKNIIYGRYNKGSIIMPQVRKYILDIDSTKIM